MENTFGGKWTEEKLEILETYAKQYLKVFRNKPDIPLLYFDGFAGSGDIKSTKEGKLIKGSVLRILGLNDPRPFDLYYFVEKDKKFADQLSEKLKKEFPKKNYHVIKDDCNEKLKAMGSFLKSEKGKYYKVLAFIDPKGMQLEYESLLPLKGLSVDLWVLNTTSGANRLLKRDGNIKKSWLERLKVSLDLSEEEIKIHFYSPSPQATLFGEPEIVKEKDSIDRLHELFVKKLEGNLFKYVSKPRVLRDDQDRILFHFFMATNSEIALRIANSVIDPIHKL